MGLASLVQPVEFLLGLILAIVTLHDVFDTVVVPGTSRARLRIARRLVFLLLPLWKLRARRGKRTGLDTGFAPTILVGAFATWMLLLLFGFGLMAHGLRQWFDPPAETFAQALYAIGGALVTIGLTDIRVLGPVRWLTIAAGFCGLAVMTMAVTYLLEVQQAVGRRDAGILKLNISAGSPPSALGLFERYAALDSRSELKGALHEARDWCAAVLQSHAAHPSLIYFRTIGTESGWPAALGALLDAAALLETAVDLPELRGAAALLREQGTRMARDLAEVAALEPRPAPAAPGDAERLAARVAAAGYPLVGGEAMDRFLALRREHADCIAAMADHLGTAEAPLIP